MTGMLTFDRHTECLAILGKDGTTMPLHCGQELRVKYNNKWHDTQVDYGNDWYLVGMFGDCSIPKELKVCTV